MALINDIALLRSQKVFVVPETTKGTLAYPTAAHAVFPTNSVDLQQQPGYSESEEIMDTRSLIDEFRDATAAGSWSIDVYARPTAAGTVPVEGALIEAALGAKAVTPSTSVIYSLGKALASLSVWVQKGHALFFASGLTVNQLNFSASKSGGLKLSFSGGFMKRGWAGTSELKAAASAGATNITVADADKYYTVDARIAVGSDTNSGSGYRVSAVSGNTLTISPALVSAASVNAVVAPHLPTPVVSGTPVQSRTMYAVINGVNVPVTALDFALSNNIAYLEDEISVEEYATDYSADKRSASGKVSVYFRREDLPRFKSGYSGDKVPLVINSGTDAGKRMQVTMPNVRLSVPALSGDREVKLDIDYKALATSAGEDEVSFKYY